MQGHILRGLQLHGFQNIRDLGFSCQLKILDDSRCAVIAGSFNKLGSTDENGNSGDTGNARDLANLSRDAGRGGGVGQLLHPESTSCPHHGDGVPDGASLAAGDNVPRVADN